MRLEESPQSIRQHLNWCYSKSPLLSRWDSSKCIFLKMIPDFSRHRCVCLWLAGPLKKEAQSTIIPKFTRSGRELCRKKRGRTDRDKRGENDMQTSKPLLLSALTFEFMSNVTGWWQQPLTPPPPRCRPRNGLFCRPLRFIDQIAF